jgi:hypothetical protein
MESHPMRIESSSPITNGNVFIYTRIEKTSIFMHSEMSFTSENLLAVNARVIHIITSNIPVTAAVAVAVVRNMNTMAITERRTVARLATNRTRRAREGEFPRFAVPRILDCEKKTLL